METCVKGFKDLTGKDSEKRAFINEIIRRTFEKYNFEQVETPIIEYEEFVKGEGNQDEVISDIFKLKDKGKRDLALRYEFTFQLKRIAKNKKLPYRRFQIGPVFRDEPVQGNRLRQFTQCDIDIVGATIKDEAEILSAVKDILDSLKIDFVIYINNRKLLNEILDELNLKQKEDLIREIDKIDKLPENEIKKNLEKYNAEKLLDIMKNKEEFFEKYESYKEIEELKKYCQYYGVKVKFSPYLARGLSYYTGNIFELKSNIKESIGGGGSYFVNGVPSTGIALGLDRLELVTNIILNIEKFLVVSLNEDKKAVQIAQQLRTQGKNVSIYYGKPSKALEYANAYGIKKVLFVGAQEIKKKIFKIKDLNTGREKVLIIEKRKINKNVKR